MICKSTDAEKKSKNIIAVLPKALVSKFFLQTLLAGESDELTFEGLVLELPEDSLPVISSQLELVAFKSQIPHTNEDFNENTTTYSSYVGVVNSADRRGVTIRFHDGLKKLVLMKDLETSQDAAKVYSVGKVVRASKNKLDRLTLKQSITYHKGRADQSTEQKDKEV